MEELAESIASKNDSKKESIIKQIISREMIEVTYRRIKNNLRKIHDCRLRTVLATDFLGNKVEYVKREEIEAACVAEALRRFT